MPLIRNTKQGQHQTLEEVYQECANSQDPFSVSRGEYLLMMIDAVNLCFPQTILWGLTSMDRLVIQTENRWDSPWYVIITYSETREWTLEYLLPADQRPWENAYVRGIAYSWQEALHYLLIAMSVCGGWPENEELARALSEFD